MHVKAERYLKKLFVLGNEILDIIWKRVLPRSGRERYQVVVVNKIVTTNSDEDECLINQLLSSLISNNCSHSLLVLLEVFQLSEHSYYVHLQFTETD